MYNDVKNDSINNKLILDLVFGFIICQICFAIPCSIGKNADNICIILISSISGFLLGKFINNKHVNPILDKLKIRRTVNAYLWNDLMDKELPMKAKITINNTIYDGKIHLIEECSNSPHIVLAEYSVNGKKSTDENKIIVLDSSKATEIIVEYDKNSSILDEIKFEAN